MFIRPFYELLDRTLSLERERVAMVTGACGFAELGSISVLVKQVSEVL